MQGIEDEWGPHEENTARLLDTRSYALDLQWADRTIDPNDPEVVRARRAMRHRKPPPHPIIPPVALRPERVMRQRIEEYAAALEELEPAKPKVVSLDEWEKAAGLI